MDVPDHLSRRECLDLLARRTVGRVVFTERALPAIRPVRYTLIGTHIVLADTEPQLADRLDGQVVAFQIDQEGAPDPLGRLGSAGSGGWSVVVTGTARRLPAPDGLTRVHRVAPRAVGPTGRTTIGIACGEVRGTRTEQRSGSDVA
jgi:nitroimidazol reductase NimA-like FMN-containing flavoprotein (pyridoxamine 5'-phosphate oxidase superfamily)